MSRLHGTKVLSECCNARLRYEQNGEWGEQFCRKCSQPLDPNGKVYSATRTLIEPTVAQRPDEEA